MHVMADPATDVRLAGGSVWRLPGGILVVVVASPSGFILVSWPPERGMHTHVLASGDWEFPDKHALAEVLKDATHVSFAEESHIN